MQVMICPSLFEMARRLPPNAVQVAAIWQHDGWRVTYIVEAKK